MFDFLFSLLVPLEQSLGVLLYTGIDIISFIIRVSALVAIPQRHTPSTATAWLLCILLWPWLGIIAYSLLGTNILPSRRLQRHKEALLHFKDLRIRLKNENFPGTVTPKLTNTLAATAQLAENLGYMRALQGNSVEFITDSDIFINRLVDEIDKANFEICLLYYIFEKDNYGRKILEACRSAAKRGVVVRLLLDSVGSRNFLKSKLAKEARNDGIIIAEALPVRIYRAKVERFDLRNHRKLAIFDRTTAITGSHNITIPTYGRKDGLTWKDLSLRLQGPVVRQLECVFIEDWYVETGQMLDTPHLFAKADSFPGKFVLQTVPSGPSYQTENYQRIIIAAIISAQKQVTITSPYLIPDDGMLQAIEVARLRNVKVRLVVPARSDQIITGYASRAYYNTFLMMGVDVYLYKGGLLHAKTITIDEDLGFVGSSNFDIRSFALNFEINMIFYGEKENSGVRMVQNKYIQGSHLLTSLEWRKRGRFSIAFESLTKLMSPLL